MIPDDSRSRDHRGVTWERRLARSTRSYIGTAVERAVEDNITCYHIVQYNTLHSSSNSYCTLLYYTVLYCTVIYCTVLYCNVRCKYIGNHSRNDYFGFITANFLEFNTRGDRGG